MKKRASEMADFRRNEVQRLVEDATGDEQMVGIRRELMDRYLGEKYGDEQKGKSQFIDSAVSDAVEGLMPDIMEVLVGADNVAKFEAVGPDDEEAAQQETDAVEHVFWRMNKGFFVAYTWVKEALICQNAYVWSGWVDKERVTIEEYDELTIEELINIISNLEGDYEFLEQSGFAQEKDPELGVTAIVQEFQEDGQPAPIYVKIRCVKTEKKYLIEPFPQADFFGTPRHDSIYLDDIPCCGRRQTFRRAQLLAMGFDEDSIDEAHEAADDNDDDLRHTGQDISETEADDDNEIEVYLAYVRMDYNNNGKECLVKVWTAGEGRTVLRRGGKDAMEEVSRVEITALTPFIMPHRHIGRSVSEQVDDLQRLNTVLWRQMLDNIYGTNYPRPYFDESMTGEDTMQDLQNPAPGAPVRTGGAQIDWVAPQSVSGHVLPLLDRTSAMREERTGSTRYNQGLDANSLNKTASGISQIMGAGQKKAQLIVRTLLETGFMELMLRIHADLRSGPIKELTMKLRGNWVPISPQTWIERTDITPNVGTGRGDKDETREGHMAVGALQRELMAAGSDMVTPQEVYNNAKRVAKTYGIESLDGLILDPSTIPPKQPQPAPPDPMQIMTDAQVGKLQSDAQRDIQKLMLDREKAQQDFALRMKQLELETIKATNQVQNETEAQELAEKKAVMEDDFKRDKLEIDAATAYMRDTARAVSSQPPMDYNEVTD